MASFLDSILDNKVSASTNTVNTLEQKGKNSQNMPLLQANVSFTSILQDQKAKDSKNSKEVKNDVIDTNFNVNIVSDNALVPNASPKEESESSVGGGFGGELEIYVAHTGDTVAVVADLFGVSEDTILSANDLTKGAKLKEGDVLLVLPYSGVEHEVAKGETLQGIAIKYKVELSDILDANDLDTDATMAIGEKLMVPGASILSNPKPKSGSSIAKGGSSVKSGSNYYINPVPSAKKSRGVKPGHKGVDLAAPTGTSIKAAASGTVLIARNGWNGGFGNYVVMQHPNGVKTLYAHMSQLGTTPGAKVSQGENIGYVGNTGRSTGAHTHFETIGGKNPL